MGVLHAILMRNQAHPCKSQTLFLGNRNPLNRNRRIGASASTGTLLQWQQGSGATLHNSNVKLFYVTFTIFVCLMSSLDGVL